MKNYLIIIPGYTGVGGAQLYAIRRANYLKTQGYNVSFLVSTYDNTYLETPDNVAIYFIEDLNRPTICLAKSKISSILVKFKEQFKYYHSLIIESFSIEASTWGELLAEHFGGKHICYFLGEPYLYQFRYRYFLKFCLFKYHRGELIGLSDCSLKIILGPYFKENHNNYVNISFDNSEIDQVTKSLFLNNLDSNSFTIGTISRLNKEYIIFLIDAVINLAFKYPKHNFNLIICGDGVGNGYKVGDFKAKYSNENLVPNNLKLIFTGYVYPIGQDFFKFIDVFVGMGTAAVSSISQKSATICVDPRVNKSIGILGIQTNNFAYSISGNYFSIYDSIESLLLDRNMLNQARISGYELFCAEFENVRCMEKLDSFISKSCSNKIYFSSLFSPSIGFFYILMIKGTYLMKRNRFLTGVYRFITQPSI